MTADGAAAPTLESSSGLRSWRAMRALTWIARNDRSAEVNGTRLGDLSCERLPDGLPDEVHHTMG